MWKATESTMLKAAAKVREAKTLQLDPCASLRIIIISTTAATTAAVAEGKAEGKAKAEAEAEDADTETELHLAEKCSNACPSSAVWLNCNSNHGNNNNRDNPCCSFSSNRVAASL